MANISILLFALLAAIAQAANYYNPIKMDSADPFMVYASGKWYLVNTGGNVGIISASTVAELYNAPRNTVYSGENSTLTRDFWAPEIHNFDGTWYIFVTAAPQNSDPTKVDAGRRTVVLKSLSSTPAGPYQFQTVLNPPNDTSDGWAIDATVLFDGGNHYLVWSCHNGNTHDQSICVGQLNGPTSLLNRVVISNPTNAWERIGGNTNEGPSAVYYNGHTYLAFSASSCGTANYTLGILAYNGGGILNANSWTKSGPHFTSANGEYGPGHNGFVLNPGTQQDWYQVYHATNKTQGGCDNFRNTFLEKVNFDSNNFPQFGQPDPVGGPLAGPSGEGN